MIVAPPLELMTHLLTATLYARFRGDKGQAFAYAAETAGLFQLAGMPDEAQIFHASATWMIDHGWAN